VGKRSTLLGLIHVQFRSPNLFKIGRLFAVELDNLLQNFVLFLGKLSCAFVKLHSCVIDAFSCSFHIF
jgi:hypothetical protein